MTDQTAVLLMAYGGPDTLADIEPYLLDVRGGRQTSPELVEEVRARYAAIGGGSPLLPITRLQAGALQAALDSTQPGAYRVFIGMRHWHPYIRETIAAIAQAGITRITALCMTPFDSRMSTGAYYEHLDRAVEAQDAGWRESLQVRRVGAWFHHPDFVGALAANVRQSLAGWPGGERPVVLFTAHSLPAALAEQGDPYAQQFAQLCALVAQAAGLNTGEWLSCYQSAGARNTRWLGPSLEETIRQLAGEGKKSLLVSPVGFLSDHVEVLYDIDIEAQRSAAEAGVRLARTASLNDQPRFIHALEKIIQSVEMEKARS